MRRTVEGTKRRTQRSSWLLPREKAVPNVQAYIENFDSNRKSLIADDDDLHRGITACRKEKRLAEQEVGVCVKWRRDMW